MVMCTFTTVTANEKNPGVEMEAKRERDQKKETRAKIKKQTEVKKEKKKMKRTGTEKEIVEMLNVNEKKKIEDGRCCEISCYFIPV